MKRFLLSLALIGSLSTAVHTPKANAIGVASILRLGMFLKFLLSGLIIFSTRLELRAKSKICILNFERHVPPLY